MVRTPALEREELTASGLTPRGRAKLWLKLCVEKLRPSEVFSSCVASTTTLLSMVLIMSSSGRYLSTLIRILYMSSSYTTRDTPLSRSSSNKLADLSRDPKVDLLSKMLPCLGLDSAELNPEFESRLKSSNAESRFLSENNESLLKSSKNSFLLSSKSLEILLSSKKESFFRRSIPSSKKDSFLLVSTSLCAEAAAGTAAGGGLGSISRDILFSTLSVYDCCAAGLPRGAVITSTPSRVNEDLTSSAFTPEGMENFCSKTRVLTPPASWVSCLAVMMIVLPSTRTSRSSGLYSLASSEIWNLSSS